MFRIIVNGEVVETVMYNNITDIRKYVWEEYRLNGIKAKYERVRC